MSSLLQSLAMTCWPSRDASISLRNLPSIDQHDLYARISGHERYRDTMVLADDIITEWIHSLPVGSLIDVFLGRESTWYQAKVLVNNSQADDSLRVRYQGWGPKYDETICISASRLAVQGAFIRGMRKKATRTKKTRSDEDVQLSIDVSTAAGDNDHDMQADESIAVASSDQASQCEQVRTSRSGRRIREAVQVDSDGRDKRRRSSGKERQEGTAAGGDDVAEQKDLNDWICGVCARFEAPDGSDLLMCEGNQPTNQPTEQCRVVIWSLLSPIIVSHCDLNQDYAAAASTLVAWGSIRTTAAAL